MSYDQKGHKTYFIRESWWLLAILKFNGTRYTAIERVPMNNEFYFHKVW